MPVPGNRDEPEVAEERAERRLRFGQRLRDLRELRHLTQESVALSANLDRSFYVQLEGGKRSISVERLDDLARALSVEVAALFVDAPAES